mgnify:CR=1 FL=1
MNKRRSKSAEASTLRSSHTTTLPSLCRRHRSASRRKRTRPSSEPPSSCKLPPIVVVDGNAKLKQDLNDYLKNLEKRNLIRLTTSREIERADSSSESSSSSSPLTSPRDVVVFKEEKSVVEEEEEEQSPLFMTQDISAISSPCSKEENESVRKQIEEIDRRLSELSSATPSKETDGNEASQRT